MSGLTLRRRFVIGVGLRFVDLVGPVNVLVKLIRLVYHLSVGLKICVFPIWCVV